MKEAPLVRKPELGSTPGGGRQSQTPFDRQGPSFWGKFWKWAGVFSLVSIVGLFGYFNFTTHGRATGETLSEFVPAVIESKQNPNLIFDRAGSDVVNILLIGRDVNWVVKKVYDPSRKLWANLQVPDEDTPARSDTMLIISLDRVRKSVHMVSLPRDALVHLPENKYGARQAKLNAAHAYGGPEMLTQTIREELGITIHHYAVIRFEGFKKLIDQVGGVEVDVLGALHRDGTRGRLKYDDNWGNLHIDLEPGRQVLSGEDAHSYVRFRMDIEGDPGRIKRQQQVMRALAKKLTTQSVWNIAPLVQEIRKQFETDPDFDSAKIASAADFTKNLGDPSKIQPITLFGIYGKRGSLILNKPKNKKLLHYIFASSFNEDVFLQNSPSTRRDEMGEENNSSPGARAILIRAGVIKGEPGESTPEGHDASSAPATNENPNETSNSREADRRRSRLAIAQENRIEKQEEEQSETKRARRSTRTRREETSQPRAERETPRLRRELSTPSEETPAAREYSGDDSRSESPVPVPEGLSTPDADESPVPRAE